MPSNSFDVDPSEVMMQEGVGVGFKDNAADKMLKGSNVDLAALLDDDGDWSDDDDDYGAAPKSARAKDEVEEEPALTVHQEDEPQQIQDMPASEVEDEEIGDKDKLAAGTSIEARFGGSVTYYPGKIDKMNRNGTYSILYEDGDSESAVARDLIRIAPLAPPQPAVRPGFKAPPVMAVQDDYDLDFEDDLDEEFM
jgi:hypothetical protein